MPGSIVLLTDSTATLPLDVCETRGIVVVPLQVVIGAKSYDEGPDGTASPQTVAEALREWTPVSTSRPTPAAILEAYEKAVAGGATEIVSIHLSSQMSGTFESAQLAAADASVPVTVVDTKQLGMATGFCVLTAADVLDSVGSAADAAAEPPESSTSAAVSTQNPVAMPSCLVSTTVTGTDASAAASWADSKVPLIWLDRWIDTISVAPPATAFS